MSQRPGTACSVCLIAGLSLALVPARSVAQTGTIGLNFTGVTLADGQTLNNINPYAPPDSDGAVGPSNIVQLINGAFAVYDKTTGTRQELISGSQFWINAHVEPGTDISHLGAFNNRIVYDPTVGRWIAVGLTTDPINNYVMVARSDTADPRGTWQAVKFPGNIDINMTGGFADFTRLGVNADGVYIGTDNFTDHFPGGGSLVGTSLFSLPKASLMAASPVTTGLARFDGVDTDVVGMSAQPIINFGASGHAPVLGTSLANSDSVLFRSDVVGGNAAGAHLANDVHINVNPYSLPPAAAQPNGTRSVGTIDARFTANVYQVGNRIYAAHTVQGPGANAAIDWVILNEATNTVIQEGILSSPNFDYFQPSIAANANGDIVMSFTRSGLGAGGNLSDMAVVGKLLGNTTNFGDPFFLKVGTVSDYHLFSGRWGDYTTTQVDPNNPNVFWTFEEYAQSETSWATLITQITVPEPDSLVMAGMALAGISWAAWRRRRVR